MTERLYYHDSFLKKFDAHVLSCEEEAGRWKVRMDRTAFYPTSGGQPHDTGTLAGVPVVEVADAEDHTIVHYVSAAIPPGRVEGEIDWPRRIDHMQQHTGQHILSAVFLELFRFPTVSFHLGKEIATVDLEAPSVMTRHLEEAERRANEIIFEDRVVNVIFGTAQQLEEAGIRKRVDREGVLRAVEIEGLDRQPCGGTHLARTGQAGMLQIRKLERRRESWRLEFVCGYRAMAAARGDFHTLSDAASLLSCGLTSVPLAVEKAIAERRALHSEARQLEERVAEYEAKELLKGCSNTLPGRTRMVSAALQDATPEYLALLGRKLTLETPVVALLASRSSGHLVFAQSKGLMGDMNGLLRETLKEFSGKGGGSKDFAQGNIRDAAQMDPLLARASELASI